MQCAGSAEFYFYTPCRHAAATHFDFLVRPLGGLYECLEMLQGVWGRVPVGLVSIVMYAVLAGLACGVVRHESFELAGLRGWPAIILYAKVSTLS